MPGDQGFQAYSIGCLTHGRLTGDFEMIFEEVALDLLLYPEYIYMMQVRMNRYMCTYAHTYSSAH